MKKQRNSNIELLRIIAMFMIVLHHAVVHGALDKLAVNFYAVPYFSEHAVTILVLQCLVVLGKVGVSIFVVVTGYFMVNSKFSLTKVKKLWILIFSYSIVLYFFSVFIGAQKFIFQDLLKSFFPILSSNYWFMTAYFVLYLFVPAINVFLKNASSVLRARILVLLFLLNIVLPIVFAMVPSYVISLGSSNVSGFILLYLVGAELRLRKVLQKKYLSIGRLLLYGSFLGYVVSVILLDYIGIQAQRSFIIEHATVFSGTGSNGIFAFGMAIGAFVIMGTKKVSYSPVINKTATVMLAVYLIHDNPYIRIWLWHSLLHLETISSEFWLNAIGRILLVSVIIFSFTILMAQITQKLYKFFGKIAGIKLPLFTLFKNKQ